MRMSMKLFATALLFAGLLTSPGLVNASGTGLCCLEPTGNIRLAPPSDPRGAGDVVLDFEGLSNQQPVADFYAGGMAGGGVGPGPDYGITFGDASLSIIAQTAGGTGNFANNPSGVTILFFLSGSAIMNVPSGFDTGFSFFYAAANNPGVVRVYDDVDGTGNLLAELNLPATGTGPTPYDFDVWAPIGVAFDGTARSVDFGGTANQIGFDNITLGSIEPGDPGSPGGPPLPSYVPVPTLSTLAQILLALGLMLFGWVAIRR